MVLAVLLCLVVSFFSSAASQGYSDRLWSGRLWKLLLFCLALLPLPWCDVHPLRANLHHGSLTPPKYATADMFCKHRCMREAMGSSSACTHKCRVQTNFHCRTLGTANERSSSYINVSLISPEAQKPAFRCVCVLHFISVFSSMKGHTKHCSGHIRGDVLVCMDAFVDRH